MTAIFANLTVKLYCLARLFAEIMYNNRLYCHLNDIAGMGSIQLCAKQLREVIINPHGSMISFVDFGERASTHGAYLRTL